MATSRRKFLMGGLSFLTFCLAKPEMFLLAARAAEIEPRQPGKSKILVLIQMGGGNDGLNTVVPYGIGNYYQMRPTIGIKPDQVIPLTQQIGLNPNMQGMADLYKAGKLAVIQAVGYPNPNRSHFRSMEIWQTAQPEQIAEDGWLGRYLDLAVSGQQSMQNNILPAVNCDPILPMTLTASKVVVPSVNTVYDFRFKTDPRYTADRNAQIATFNNIYNSFDLSRPNVELLRNVGIDANKASDFLLKVVQQYKGNISYPDNPFAQELKFIAQMICGGVSARIYNVSLNGFDTHANQARIQNNLLKQLSNGISAFQKDLEDHGLDQDVIVMAFTEFGRRVSENGGHGTDHGTAEPLFIIGTPVRGGVYGNHANLNNLDNGDLRFQIDFRTVYATVLDRWLDADSREILGANYGYLPFV